MNIRMEAERDGDLEPFWPAYRQADGGVTFRNGVVLTKRECDVLNELQIGKTNQEIASALRLRPPTIRNRLVRIREKSGLSRVRVAVLWTYVRMSDDGADVRPGA